MKKITIISNKNDRLTECFSGCEGSSVQLSENTEILPDVDCVLISQEFAGDRINEMVQELKRRNIPAAVLTFDRSDENEEKLFDMGITQIIKLPISPGLLKKRIGALTCISEQDSSDTGFSLFLQMAAADDQRGAYVVQEADFTNIYKLVRRLQERMDKQAQLVRFSFHTRLNDRLEPGTLEEAFPIVQKCLRRGDIVSIYGDDLLAILIGADEEGGRIAAERIVNTYHAHCCDSGYDMSCEMTEIIP